MKTAFPRTLFAALASAAVLSQAQMAPAPATPPGRLETRMATTPSRIVPVDRIVAVVNDEVITHNDLNEHSEFGNSDVPPQRAGAQ